MPRRCSLFLIAALSLPLFRITAEELPSKSKYEGSFAYKLLDNCLETAAREVDRDGARPTILSRCMAMWVTAVYDAWAAYDDKAVGTIFGGSLRRPAAERTLENKKKAIAYAGFRLLLDVYAENSAPTSTELANLAYDPNTS